MTAISVLIVIFGLGFFWRIAHAPRPGPEMPPPTRRIR